MTGTRTGPRFDRRPTPEPSPIGWCRFCRRPDQPGALLIVVPTDGSAAWHVHRPSVSGRCFAGVPRRALATIAELDPEAARAFDRAEGGAGPSLAWEVAGELALTIAARETIAHSGVERDAEEV